MLEPLLERAIEKAETDPAQSDVREHRIGQEVIGENRTDHEPGGDGGHSQHTQWTAGKPGECSRERIQSDRIVVHEEVPATGFTTFGEVHQRTGTVRDVNG